MCGAEEPPMAVNAPPTKIRVPVARSAYTAALACGFQEVTRPVVAFREAKRARCAPCTCRNTPPMNTLPLANRTARTVPPAPPPQIRVPAELMAAMFLAAFPPTDENVPPAKMVEPLAASARTSPFTLGFQAIGLPLLLNAARLLRANGCPERSNTVLNDPPT